MSTAAPFGGGVFIADTSAWTRVDRLSAVAQNEWQRALVNDQIAACPPITVEILYSAQTPADFDLWQTDSESFAAWQSSITTRIGRRLRDTARLPTKARIDVCHLQT